LKITAEALGDRQLSLTVEVDEERAQKVMRQAARLISREVSIAGFRKGKAPYDLIVQRYGEETVRREAAEALAEPVYREALEQEGIQPYATAALKEMELDPISFKFTVPLYPVVDLGDYRRYRLKFPKVRVTKKQVQQALEQLREENAILELAERLAALDDGVVVALVARTASGTEVLKGDDIHMFLNAQSANPVPGFAEAVVGMKAGEERTFTLSLPEDFPREELRGQEAEFMVTMKEVYDTILPALDDDLARTVGNFDSLKELRAHVKEQLQQAAQQAADEEYAKQVLEDFLERAQVEYPPVMLEEELKEVVREFERTVKRQARLSLEDYLRFQDKSMEELEEELRPAAADRLKRALVLGEVVRLEELEVGEDEVEARIEAASAPWGVRADEVRGSLSSDEGRQAMLNRLLADKSVQRLVAIAKGEVKAREAESKKDAEDQGWLFSRLLATKVVQRLVAIARGEVKAQEAEIKKKVEGQG
jgi:trigger factor